MSGSKIYTGVAVTVDINNIFLSKNPNAVKNWGNLNNCQ